MRVAGPDEPIQLDRKVLSMSSEATDVAETCSSLYSISCAMTATLDLEKLLQDLRRANTWGWIPHALEKKQVPFSTRMRHEVAIGPGKSQ